MKRLLLVCVLVAAFMGLLAAPAFASDPYDGWPLAWMPNTAYVHPWGDPPYWEEMYWAGGDWVWTAWDTDRTPGPSFRYKAIPSSYDVWFVVWLHGAPPQGQFEALPENLRLDGHLNDADGVTVWSTTVEEAMKLWGPAFQMPPGWEVPTFNKGDQPQWAIAWTYHQGPMDPGVYTGKANYLVVHQINQHYAYDPAQQGPARWEWKGLTSSFPDFRLTVK